MGPSADLGGFTWYLGLWVAMTAAMMLPSATPALLLVDRLSPRATPGFVAGYPRPGRLRRRRLRAPRAAVTPASPTAATGPLIAAAGLYGLTPLKRACLQRCRSPLQLLLRHERLPPLGPGSSTAATAWDAAPG